MNIWFEWKLFAAFFGITVRSQQYSASYQEYSVAYICREKICNVHFWSKKAQVEAYACHIDK